MVHRHVFQNLTPKGVKRGKGGGGKNEIWFYFLVAFFLNMAYTLCNINNKRSITAFSKMEPLRRLKGEKEGKEVKMKNNFFSRVFMKLGIPTYFGTQIMKFFSANFPKLNP